MLVALHRNILDIFFRFGIYIQKFGPKASVLYLKNTVISNICWSGAQLWGKMYTNSIYIASSPHLPISVPPSIYIVYCNLVLIMNVNWKDTQLTLRGWGMGGVKNCTVVKGIYDHKHNTELFALTFWV